MKRISEKNWFLAESGLWDAGREQFFFVNIFDGELYEYRPETGALKGHSFGRIVSAAMLGKHGELILATQTGIGIYDTETGSFEKKAHPNQKWENTSRYNDCKCDPAGRMYVGTMDLHGRPGCGKLYCVEPDWSWRVVFDSVDYSNGLVWIGDKMYYTDTYSGEVYCFDYDLRTGSMKHKRVLCAFPPGQPDGMAADWDGNLWIALWGGYGIACVDSKTGKLLRKIEMPVPNVSSICFGGRDGGKVLITTARKDMSEGELSRYPQAGSVYYGNIGVSGPEFYKF